MSSCKSCDVGAALCEDTNEREEAAQRRAVLGFAHSNPYLLISAAVAYLLKENVVYDIKILFVNVPITSLRALYMEFYATEQSVGFFESREAPPMVVAALLWYHLKTLAKSLFPCEMFEDLLAVVESRIPNVDYIQPSHSQAQLVLNSIRHTQLSELVLQLPQQNRACLSCLFSFFHGIEQPDDASPIELANICTPFLCRPKGAAFMSIKHREGVVFVRYVIQAMINEYKDLANDFTSIQKTKQSNSPHTRIPAATETKETKVEIEGKELLDLGQEGERRVISALIVHTVTRALDPRNGWLASPVKKAPEDEEKEMTMPPVLNIDVVPETEEDHEEEPLGTVSEDERLMSSSDDEKGEKEKEKPPSLVKRLGKSASEGSVKTMSGNQNNDASIESRIERELDRTHERARDGMKQRREGLEAEKKMLKRQLKDFDDSFEREHGRKPQKADKETIRHLYEAYNAVKLLLSTEENVPSMQLTAKSVQSLLNEKRQLQAKLRKFEREFEEKHSRKVMFTKDIIGLEGDYRRYKDLKNQLLLLRK